jgi:NADH-quinone oxidoreductase subunit J
MVIPIILGAAGYLLVQEGVVRHKFMLGLGLVSLAASAIFAARFLPPTLDAYIVFLFCIVATGGGVGFLTAREPVYAALGFASAVLSTCGILFMQSAMFIAAATMIVYAGATIIIFLFVLMFAQQTDLRVYDIKLTNPWLAGAIGTVMMITITYCVTHDGSFPLRKVDSSRLMSEALLPDNLQSEEAKIEFNRQKLQSESGPGIVPQTTAGLGRSLYTDYLIAVELAGTVLLVATIGAIALATKPTAEAGS